MPRSVYGTNLDKLNAAVLAEEDQDLKARTANQGYLAQLAGERNRQRAVEQGNETARLASQRQLEASLGQSAANMNIADVQSGRSLEGSLAATKAQQQIADWATARQLEALVRDAQAREKIEDLRSGRALTASDLATQRQLQSNLADSAGRLAGIDISTARQLEGLGLTTQADIIREFERQHIANEIAKLNAGVYKDSTQAQRDIANLQANLERDRWGTSPPMSEAGEFALLQKDMDERRAYAERQGLMNEALYAAKPSWYQRLLDDMRRSFRETAGIGKPTDYIDPAEARRAARIREWMEEQRAAGRDVGDIRIDPETGIPSVAPLNETYRQALSRARPSPWGMPPSYRQYPFGGTNWTPPPTGLSGLSPFPRTDSAFGGQPLPGVRRLYWDENAQNGLNLDLTP